MSSLPADPYKALGVAKDAPLAEIRSAHRKLVLQCHPDKVQDPKLKAEKADEFQRVQQAYEILSDENERQKYDEQARMAELRRQAAANSKANTSSPRTSRHAEYEIRTAEPRPSSYKTGPSMPRTKSYTTYSRSWTDEPERGPRIFETEIRTSSRRETSYNEKHSKRGDREKERERERRKREDDARYQDKIAEKQAKEARRQERRKQEKAKDKEHKRESERKRENAKPYVEDYDEESSSGPRPEKKKSSSKKHDEKRERSSHREDGAPMPPPTQPGVSDNKYEYAASYIDAARSKRSNASSATYHAARADRPPAPTPPMAAGQTSAYPVPEDDGEDEVRRSSARTRRGSSEVPRMGREKSYRKTSSRDPLAEDVYVVHSSPKLRHSGGFDGPPMSSSPRSGGLGRTNTMPVDAGSYSRPIPVPGISRAQTFSGGYGDVSGSLPRGRERSRMHAQVEEESEDSEEDYEQQRRRERSDRKHRSRKHRSSSREYSRYQTSDGRAPLSSSYSRQMPAEVEIDGHRYHPSSRSGTSRMDSRPPQSRGASFSGHGAAKYSKFKESKAYDYSDVVYSNEFVPEPYAREREAGMA